MLQILGSLAVKANESGLIIPVGITKALDPHTNQGVAKLPADDVELDLCHQYRYLGVTLNSRVHPKPSEQTLGTT